MVPVAGLVMARFHMYNCELNTAIELWKVTEMQDRKLKGYSCGGTIK